MKIKHTLIINFILIVVAVFFVGLLQSIDFDNLGKDTDTLELGLEPVVLISGESRVFLDVAQNNADRIMGLSGRDFLKFDEGMLFVFPAPERAGFWMKDMNFPIDIAWLDEEFRLVHLESSVLPSTYPKIFKPSVPAKYVVEVASGFFQKSKIVVGDYLVLKNLD